MLRTVKSPCRICIYCGFDLDVEDGRIVAARPDADHPVSRGYACAKGADFVRFLQGDGVPRLRESRKRLPDGRFAAIDAETALDEVAAKLAALRRRYGPRSIALYTGTGSYANTIAYGMARSFVHEIGTPNLFSTVTIDQPQKVTTPARMGLWLGGKRSHHDVDVMLTAGNNPFVSHLGNPMTPAPGLDPNLANRELRRKGVRHIVVDPRRTELAKHADIHLQLLPGEDATLFAGIVHVILRNGWQNREFCDRWVVGVDRLREHTAAFDPHTVARRCDVRAEDVVEAARIFSHAKHPMAGCGTGTCMTPHSNAAEFLVESLNALCGGYRRAGEEVPNRGVFFGMPPIEDVLPPNRTWKSAPWCRTQNVGRIGGELPTPLLPDEILAPGDDKIRALIVFSGNPAVALVDPGKTRTALRDLELLVTLDSRETETTALSHYVIATSTFFERHELSGYLEFMFERTFAELSKPVVEKPPGVIHDWELFWGVARRMGIRLEYKYLGLLMDYAALPPGLALSMESKPSEEEILAWICEQRGLSYAELSSAEGGIVYDLPPLRVAALPEDSGRRLDVCPDDVALEIDEVRKDLAASADGAFPYRLASRRLPHVMNSLLRGTPRLGEKGEINHAHMNPEDMRRDGVAEGGPIRIGSRTGEIVAVAISDATVRRSVISMAHGFDGPRGAHTGRLVPLAAGHRERISFMPHQTGVPVRVRKNTS